MNSLSAPLLSSPLYQGQDVLLDEASRLDLSYKRAKALCELYGMTTLDILYLSEKFWNFHLDLIHARDVPAYILNTIQYNLAGGTIANYAKDRKDLQPLLKKILNFEVSAQFLLTEIAHGLDAKNLETTATLLSDGSFELNTPHENAAKYMPPTAPAGGVPRIGVVMAQLMVEGESRGIRPFLVSLADRTQMCRGVKSKILPPFAGCQTLDHALTFFDHVKLPPSALLGELEMPADIRQNFFSAIGRVGVGTLALTLGMIPILKTCVFITGKYSLQRLVGGPQGKMMPIIAFRTQQKPILEALAKVTVMEAFARKAIRQFTDRALDPRIRHGIGVLIKAVLVLQGQSSCTDLRERCGAQGLFTHNQLAELEGQIRGGAIAEGELLAVSIKLASELLLGRYRMPSATKKSFLLSQHEIGLFAECQELAASIEGGHRSAEYNNILLPRCLPLVEAIGHRMAYEAAVEVKVSQELLDVYECHTMSLDSSWYSEKLQISRIEQMQRERKALDRLLPKLNELLDDTGVAPYVTAPILSTKAWKTFVDSIESHTGDAEVILTQEKTPLPNMERQVEKMALIPISEFHKSGVPMMVSQIELTVDTV